MGLLGVLRDQPERALDVAAGRVGFETGGAHGAMLVLAMRIAIAAALLAACATVAPFTPGRASRSGASQDDLYKSAILVLSEEGLSSSETSNSQAGLVVTPWENTETMGSMYRYRWRITVADGSVTVHSQCQSSVETAFEKSAWQTCTHQPAGRSEEASRLADDIAEHAK